MRADTEETLERGSWDGNGPRLILREALPRRRSDPPPAEDQAREAVAYYFHGRDG